jgi:hypothetical protein
MRRGRRVEFDGGGEQVATDGQRAGQAAAAVLEDHRDRVPRLWVAGEADEPGVRLAVADLGGPGLAADDQSGQRRRGGVPVACRRDHHLPNPGRRLRGNRLPPNCRLRPFEHLTAGRDDPVDEVGLRDRAAAGVAGRDQGHLKRSHEQLALAERGVGEGDRVVDEAGGHLQPADGDRQVERDAVAEPESFGVLSHEVRAQGETDLGEDDVEGPGQAFG